MKRQPIETAKDLVKIAREDYGKKWGPRDVELFELAEDYIRLQNDFDEAVMALVELYFDD